MSRQVEATLAHGATESDSRELLNPRYAKPLLLGVGLAVLQQWCGINVIFNYAQEVFTAAFRDVAKIQPGSLSGFLYRLTSHRVHDRFRRRRVRETFARWFGASEPTVDHDGPERAAMRKDAERHVGRILSKLDLRDRVQIVVFAYETGLITPAGS